MTVISDDASADRVERLLDLFLAATAVNRWIHRANLEDALRPGGPRSIRRGAWLVKFDGRNTEACPIVGRFEDWGDGPGSAP